MKLKFQLTFNPSDEENNLGGEFDARKDGVFVCGSLDSLGSWHLTRALEMKTTAINTTEFHSTPDSYSSYSSLSSVSSLDLNSESSFPGGISNGSSTISTKSQSNCFEFETTIDLDESAMKFINEHNGIQYKYFVAQKSSSESRPIFLKQIEYNWRQVDAEKLVSGDSVELSDKWPLVDVEQRRIRIDSGWLIDQAENELQFHFFNRPLELWTRPSNADLVVDIVPLKHASPSGSGGLTILKDYLHLSNDFDENNSVTNRRTRLNSLNEPGFYSSHRVRFRENPSDLLFQINLYVINEEGRIDEKQPPIATGYYKVNKYILENSLVDVDISLMSANQMVGTLKTEVLIITGPKKLDNTMIKKNFNYHFNKSCIPIGHRGMGKTFDAGTLPGTNFVENTIESFREAYNRGAQMVEFDIVLTKDKIPIVYHDFVFCIDQLSSNADKKQQQQQQQQQQQDENTNPTTNTNTKSQSNNNLLSLAVNMLTYDEVKQNRIYSQKILKKSPNLPDELKEFFTSKMMFPTLKEMCTQLDPKLGFNVEIKYPIDLEDGSHEVEDHLIKWLNRNEYVDCILNELYEWCKDDNRCVILSSFDPNLCSMLRMKQNKFPVLFLTNGVTNKWVPYKDARCKKTRISLNFAKTENLHGIVAHAEELTKNLHLINILFNHASKSANFLAYSWGDDLNELDKRRLLTESGINGIIYDRINESK